MQENTSSRKHEHSLRSTTTKAVRVLADPDVSNSTRNTAAVGAPSSKLLVLEYKTNLNNRGEGEVMEGQATNGHQGSGVGNVEVVLSGNEEQQQRVRPTFGSPAYYGSCPTIRFS